MNREIKLKIKQEQAFYNPTFRSFILGYDRWYMSRYLLHLRLAEYYGKSSSNILRMILGGFHMYMNRYYGRKTGFQIPRYTCAFGLRIHHWGAIIINKDAKIGRNCDIYPGVVIGITSGNKVPVIGSNCFIGSGAKVFGNITVGDDVLIAPNAVVTKNIPDNVVVGGYLQKLSNINNNVVI